MHIQINQLQLHIIRTVSGDIKVIPYIWQAQGSPLGNQHWHPTTSLPLGAGPEDHTILIPDYYTIVPNMYKVPLDIL